MRRMQPCKLCKPPYGRLAWLVESNTQALRTRDLLPNIEEPCIHMVDFMNMCIYVYTSIILKLPTIHTRITGPHIACTPIKSAAPAQREDPCPSSLTDGQKGTWEYIIWGLHRDCILLSPTTQQQVLKPNFPRITEKQEVVSPAQAFRGRFQCSNRSCTGSVKAFRLGLGFWGSGVLDLESS